MLGTIFLLAFIGLGVFIAKQSRRPVEDDTDDLTDGDAYLATLAGRVGRVSSFDHEQPTIRKGRDDHA